MTSLLNALNDATAQLAHSDSARRDAEILLCHVLKKNLSYLRTYPEQIVDEDVLETFYTLLARRAEGVPVAYLIGEREFWSLPLLVDNNTLIPRPETEILVAAALELFAADHTISALDLGTGSGAIALAIAKERPKWTVTATDASIAALRMAEKNARRLKLAIEFTFGSWFSPLADRRFDLIVSNPPYVADNDPHLSQGDVRFEPDSALCSGPDGLSDIRVIVAQAPLHLFSGGWLLVEHGFDQGESVRALMANDFCQVQTLTDLAQLPRVTMGKKLL